MVCLWFIIFFDWLVGFSWFLQHSKALCVLFHLVYLHWLYHRRFISCCTSNASCWHLTLHPSGSKSFFLFLRALSPWHPLGSRTLNWNLIDSLISFFFQLADTFGWPAKTPSVVPAQVFKLARYVHWSEFNFLIILFCLFSDNKLWQNGPLI